MSIGVQVNAVFNIDDTTYNASLSIPTSALTADAPLLFNVTTQPTGSAATAASSILTVAVGATNEIYVAVAPPSDLITAAVGDIVTDLNVVVSEGTFDTTTNTFTTAAS
jgi:hypothetical protein